jgi:hypothetical protein
MSDRGGGREGAWQRVWGIERGRGEGEGIRSCGAVVRGSEQDETRERGRGDCFGPNRYMIFSSLN